MSADIFLDTNVFVYHVDPNDPRKLRIASTLIAEGLRTKNACTSTQVVQEWIAVALRKGSPSATLPAIRNYVSRTLFPLLVPSDTAALYDRALSIHERFRFHFYDAFIVAAAIEGGCTEVYSEDLQHGQRVDSVVIRNPFIV